MITGRKWDKVYSDNKIQSLDKFLRFFGFYIMCVVEDYTVISWKICSQQ